MILDNIYIVVSKIQGGKSEFVNLDTGLYLRFVNSFKKAMCAIFEYILKSHVCGLVKIQALVEIRPFLPSWVPYPNDQ